MVGEPVQQRAGEAFRTEHLGPLIEGQVGGDQDGAALVALAEDLEEEFADDQQDEAGHLPLEVQATVSRSWPPAVRFTSVSPAQRPGAVTQAVYFANMALLDRRACSHGRGVRQPWLETALFTSTAVNPHSP